MLDMWRTDQLCSLLSTTPPRVHSRLEMADDVGGGDVDILIGTDQMYRVVLWDQIEIREGLRAIETIFGYVLHGHGGDSFWRATFHSRQVESMCDLDTVGIRELETEETD